MSAGATFSIDEHARRVARLRARMREQGVDVALFDEIEAMAWLSGYGNSENRWRCVVMPVEGDPFFLIRALDATPCRQRSWIADIPTFRDWESAPDALARALSARGWSRCRLGLDFGSYGMTLARFAQLRQALPDVTFVDMGPVIWELRLLKSEAEMALLERAAAVADAAMLRAAKACVRGATQRAAVLAAAQAFIELGADPGPVGPISAGRGWDFLHGHLGDSALAEGDVVHIELIPRVDGYSARLMRCVVIGAVTQEYEDAAASLRELQDRQIAAMRPGALARDVDAILRRGVLERGLRSSFDNISGYTLGYYAAAGPRTSDFTRIFHPQADWRLEAGMVFHMYASAAGVSWSETVAIEPDGPRRLTRLPRELLRSS